MGQESNMESPRGIPRTVRNRGPGLLLVLFLFLPGCPAPEQEQVVPPAAKPVADARGGASHPRRAPDPATAVPTCREIDYDKLAEAVVTRLDRQELAADVARKVLARLEAREAPDPAHATRSPGEPRGDGGEPSIPETGTGGEPSSHSLPESALSGESPPEANQQVAEDTHEVWKVELSGREPYLGGAFAPVTIVIWGDFQCPFSRRMLKEARQLQKEYGDRMRLVWKDNPLPMHKRAYAAALAGCAARAQGRFWQMVDIILENHDALKDADLRSYAVRIGLDSSRFVVDAGSQECRRLLAEAIDAGARVGAVGVPNTYVNGRRIRGAVPLVFLRQVVAEELAKAAALEISGVPPEQLYHRLIEEGEIFTPLGEEVHTFRLAAPYRGVADDAQLVITVFVDFQCPFSAQARKVFYQLVDAFPEHARLEFRHYPLPFHEQAHLAAQASMAAHAQGKFWEMADELFRYHGKLSRTRIDRIARRLRLKMERFGRDLDDEVYRDIVDQHMNDGKRAGVSGTPSIFINGRRFRGQNRSLEALRALIQNEVLQDPSPAPTARR